MPSHTVDVLFLGGDQRRISAVTALAKQGFSPRLWDTKSDPSAADAVVLPLPLTRDGIYLSAPAAEGKLPLAPLLASLSPKQMILVGGGLSHLPVPLGEVAVDYGSDESFLLQNALLTAEGALSQALLFSDRALFGSHAAILGYGRIGRLLAMRLSAIGAEVTVFARRTEVQAAAFTDGFARRVCPLPVDPEALADCSLCCNTVPAPIVDQKALFSLPKRALFLELASLPGGIFPEAEVANRKRSAEDAVRIVTARGLPALYAPVSAGEVLADTLCRLLARRFGEQNQKEGGTP